MCFTTIIYGKEGNKVGNLGYNVLVQAIQDNKNNDDGYALRYGNELIRTLSYYKFIQTLIKKKQEIIDSNLLHLHLRKSTNTISEEFIHMWDLGGWYCAHNGILNGYSDKSKNDSLEFFKKAEGMIRKENLQGIKTLIEGESGYGVFLLTNKEGTKAMVMSKTKDINVEQYMSKEGDVIAISSDKIDDKLLRHYVFKWTSEVKKPLLFGEISEIIDFDHLPMDKVEYSYSMAKKDNFAAIIDLKESKVMRMCPLDSSKSVSRYSDYDYGYGYYNYGYHKKKWNPETKEYEPIKYAGVKETDKENNTEKRKKRGRPKKNKENKNNKEKKGSITICSLPLKEAESSSSLMGKNETYLCE